jgi:predicted Zn finger-like uncharacterized protein
MLIVCPTCATSYNIEPASLGPAGRTVRCARCKSSWFAGGPPDAMAGFAADVIAEAEAREAPSPSIGSSRSADDFGHEPQQPAARIPDPSEAADAAVVEEPLPPGEAPSLVPPMVEPVVVDAGADPVETFATRRTRMHVRRKQRRQSSKWTAVILVLFSFNVAVVLGRSEVVRYLPQTASLFEAIGLKVNLRQLNFEGVKITNDEHDGVPVLSVEGTIVSQSSNPVEVPRLRFAVRNATGQEIYTWTTKPSRSILEPGKKLPFHSRLASPPADASDVLVRFVNADDAPVAEK